MNFFSGKQPDLISAQTMKELIKTLEPSREQKVKFVHWTDGLSGFYEKFIEPNIFAIIALLCVFLFLFIKYLMKKDRIKKEKNINLNLLKKLNKQENYHVPTNVPANYVEQESYHDTYQHVEKEDKIIVDENEINYGDTPIDTLTEEMEQAVGFYGDVSGTTRKSIDELAKMMFN
jgi:hypothetical protein